MPLISPYDSLILSLRLVLILSRTPHTHIHRILHQIPLFPLLLFILIPQSISSPSQQNPDLLLTASSIDLSFSPCLFTLLFPFPLIDRTSSDRRNGIQSRVQANEIVRHLVDHLRVPGGNPTRELESIPR